MGREALAAMWLTQNSGLGQPCSKVQPPTPGFISISRKDLGPSGCAVKLTQ